jgi:hypothetical protein
MGLGSDGKSKAGKHAACGKAWRSAHVWIMLALHYIPEDRGVWCSQVRAGREGRHRQKMACAADVTTT